MARNHNGTNLCSAVNSTLQGILTDDDGLLILAKLSGGGAIPTTASLFSHGCIVLSVGTASGSSAVYENTGTTALPVWSLIGSAVTTSPLIVGDGTANATIKSNGNFDLIIQTGNATTGSITIQDGANGGIIIAANGTGTTSIGGASGTSSLEGLVAINGPVSINDVPVLYNADGAISINKTMVNVSSSGGAVALTLADATVGRLMLITMTVDGGADVVVTPANLINGTTITFNDVGDTALLYFGTGGWAFFGGTATLA